MFQRQAHSEPAPTAVEGAILTICRPVRGNSTPIATPGYERSGLSSQRGYPLSTPSPSLRALRSLKPSLGVLLHPVPSKSRAKNCL
ncbi:MAG: hypothetical protein KME42_19775 [Tildeniella nuda ZEHNDER 1965/U140]|nr:hypothetical protein [Tildeniella nuda ZEHNDER 1965/U140]